MMRKGIDVQTCSEILDLPTESLAQLRDSLNINIGQDDVVEALNRLAWRAYEEGIRIIAEGTPTMKMGLIRMMLSNMRGMMGSQSPKQMAELVDQFKSAIEMHTDDDDGDDYVSDDVAEDTPEDDSE